MREKMKRLLFAVVLLAGSGGFIQKMSAQTQTKRVTVSLKSAPVQEFFDKIKRQTGLNFIMKADGTVRKTVTVNYVDVPADVVIAKVMKQIGCGYDISDGIVTVFPHAVDIGLRVITGVVVDEEGLPLPGAVARIKGTKAVAVTDADGVYSFKIQSSPVTVVFSYVGYISQEINFPKHPSNVYRRVQMALNTDIDEVVVTGYNTVGRRKLTSSVTTLKADEVMRPGITSLDQMLEGKVPDMIFMNNSGEVGSVPRLRIRGTSTLIGNREPLWVLDGVVLQDPVAVSPEELNNPDYINRIGNAIAGINPQDIDRIDVLKDAAATALYGAKAANGVIVVTTKKGHVGKPIVRYSMNATLKERPRYTDSKIDLMNSRERVEFSKYLVENGYNFGNNPSLAGYELLVSQFYQGQINHDEYASRLQQLERMNTDWFKILTKDALSTQHTVSLSGGSDDVRYYGSLGLTRDNDVIKGNYNQRYTMSLHVDANLSRVFYASFGVIAYKNKRKYNQNEISPLDYAYGTSRAIPAYDSNGDYSYYKLGYGLNYYNYNILNELANSYDKQDGSNVNVNFTLKANISDDLKMSLITSYQTSSTAQDKWWGEKTFHVAKLRLSDYGVAAPKGDDSQSELPFGGELTHSNYNSDNLMLRLQTDYNKSFGKSGFHTIIASVGLEANSSRYKANTLVSRGYYEDRGKQFSQTSLDDYPYYRTWLEKNAYPSITDNLTNLLSLYGTISYSFKDFFTLNANARIDGSNKFGDRSNEKLLPIWSVSGNYNLSEHDFFKREWLDFLMLKASFGYQGNILDGQSPQMIITQKPTDPLYNELVSSLSVYPNPNLRWEKTTSFNAGLTLSLFHHRLQFEGEVYFKKTHDAFLMKEVASVNGVKEYVVNSGNISNSGYSLSLTAMPVRLKNFDWTLSTSFSKVFNRLETLPGQDQYELDDYLNGTALIKGKPIGTFYSYKFVGLNPTNGAPVFDDGEEHQGEMVDMTKYELYTSILEESGNREPTVSGAFNNTLRYKNWRLGAVLNYSLGSKVRLLKAFRNSVFNPTDNVNRELLNAWMKPGDELYTNIPNPLTYSIHWSGRNSNLPKIASDNFEEYNYSNIRVVSGDYLKISMLSLTYEFDKSLLAKLGLTRLALSLTGNNLITFCSGRLKGQTPQQGGFSEVQLTDCPSYTLGIDVSF